MWNVLKHMMNRSESVTKAHIIGCTLSSVLYFTGLLIEIILVIRAGEVVYWFPYIAGFASACFVRGLINNVRKLCKKETYGEDEEE